MAVTTTQTQQLYLAYFGRPAEQAGLTYWTSQANATVTQVSAAFAQSPEYTSVYGNLSRAQTIDTLYQNLFGRTAANNELNYWLNSTDVSVSNLALALVNGATGTDRLLLDAKAQYAASVTGTAGNSASAQTVSQTFKASATPIIIGTNTYTSLANYKATVGANASDATYYTAAAVALAAQNSPVFAAANATAAAGTLSNGQTALTGNTTVDFASKTAATIGLNAVNTDAVITLQGAQATSLAVTGTVAASTAATAQNAADQVDLGFSANAATTQFNTLTLGLTSNGTTDATKFVGVNVTGLTELTSIDASGSSASLLVTGNASSPTLATITLGSGNDTITASTSAAGAVAQTVNTGAGVDTITATAVNAALTVNAGAGNDIITANLANNSAANLVVNAGDGNDLVTVNAAVSTATAAHTVSITLGAGTDTLALGANGNTINVANVGTIDLSNAAGIAAANTSINANLVKVTDFSSSDVLDVTVGNNTLAATFSALNLAQAASASGAATLAEAASSAVSAAHTNAANSTVTSFQFGGNTYVAISADATFGANDGLIELTGYTGALTAGTNLV